MCYHHVTGDALVVLDCYLLLQACLVLAVSWSGTYLPQAAGPVLLADLLAAGLAGPAAGSLLDQDEILIFMYMCVAMGTVGTMRGN